MLLAHRPGEMLVCNHVIELLTPLPGAGMDNA